MVSTMCLHIKVAEFNTPSDGKGITGIPFFNEMENKSTNLRKLDDVNEALLSGEVSASPSGHYAARRLSRETRVRVENCTQSGLQ